MNVYGRINRIRLKYSALGTGIFYLAANAFALFNYAPQHDGLNYISEIAGNWEIQLGRFLQPIYGIFRGEIPAPVLIGLVSMICLTGLVYMVTDLLEINKPGFIILAGAFLSANITQTELLSSFIYVEDVCMLAALFSCLAVFILNKTSQLRWKIFSVFIMLLSLGLYQAYIAFAATLVLIIFMKNILNSGMADKKNVSKMILSMLILIISGIVYYLVKMIIFGLMNIHEVSDYHSLSNVLHALGSLPYRIYISYGSKFSMFFIRKEMSLGRIGNCLLVVTASIIIHNYFRKKNVPLKPRILFLIVLAGSTFTALMVNIGAGMIAYRLSFAIFLFYLFLISIIEKTMNFSVFTPKTVYLSWMTTGLLLLVIWSNIVYSNGAYTLQKVIFDRSISLYTRVLDDMYEVPEYVHNKTPVILLGDYTFDNYAYNYSPKEYRDLGTFKNTSVTYPQTVKNLLRYLGENVNLIEDNSIINQITANQKVLTMNSFPVKGYIQMVEGFLIINF